MVLALKLYTLGGLRVSIGDQLVPDLGTRKAEVLLVYLCTQKRPIAREILAEMFWEERAQRRALSNLRVARYCGCRPPGGCLAGCRTTRDPA